MAIPRRVVVSLDALPAPPPLARASRSPSSTSSPTTRAPTSTALITYYGFLSLFPLLLLLVTVLGFVLQGDPQLQAQLLDSALAEFPVIGSQLRENVHALKGSGVGLAIGDRGHGLRLPRRGRRARRTRSTGPGRCPRNERPNPITSRLRSLLLLLVLGAGVLVTTALAALTTGAGAFGADAAPRWPRRDPARRRSPTSGCSCSRSACSPRSEVPTRHLRVGAVVAGVGWQIVQVLGTLLRRPRAAGAPARPTACSASCSA